MLSQKLVCLPQSTVLYLQDPHICPCSVESNGFQPCEERHVEPTGHREGACRCCISKCNKVCISTIPLNVAIFFCVFICCYRTRYIILQQHKWLQSIFILLVSFSLLPPWATFVAMLMSIKDVLLNIGKLFINSKNSMRMEITYKKNLLNGVWNTVGPVG